jgi:hypothetical protein
MNQIVRSYLIEVARKRPERIVSYSELVKDCGLHINFESIIGREEIGKIFDEISTFEYQNGRPMLSALVFYKGSYEHGEGFLKMASRMTGVSVKKLKEDMFDIKELSKCYEFWKNDNNYSTNKDIFSRETNSIIVLYKRLVDEHDWAENWAYNYTNFLLTIKELKSRLQANPNLKFDNGEYYTNLSEGIDSYSDFFTKWFFEKSNGISSRGRSIISYKNLNYLIKEENFKLLAKEIILNPTIETYNSVNKWWFSNPQISNNPLLINRAFAGADSNILTSTVDKKKFFIVADYFEENFGFTFNKENYNWFSVNIELTAWLDSKLNEVLTERYKGKLERAVWRNIFVWLVFESIGKDEIIPDKLNLTSQPKGINTLPDRNRQFKGQEPIDYISVAKQYKDLGNAGEELVIEYEKEKLKKLGFQELIDEVKSVLDGKGYDVLSFDENRNEIHIEVKTTSGDINTPFFLSENEYGYLKFKPEYYYLYRIYNFDIEFNTGSFYILKDAQNQILIEPTNYRVFIKSE